jgi:hypothetical protein
MSRNYGTPRGRALEPELDGSQHVALAAHPHADGSGYIDAMPYSRAMVGQPHEETAADIIKGFVQELERR